MRRRPPESPERKLEKMLSPYKDFIIETVQHNLSSKSKIVNINSIKDIGKHLRYLPSPYH